MFSKSFENITEWTKNHLKKTVYYFDEGTIHDRALLGEKGASLCELTRLTSIELLCIKVI
jgi:hypothetical protein